MRCAGVEWTRLPGTIAAMSTRLSPNPVVAREAWPTTPPARQSITRDGRYFLTPEYQVARGQSPLLLVSSQPLSIASSTVVTG